MWKQFAMLIALLLIAGCGETRSEALGTPGRQLETATSSPDQQMTSSPVQAGDVVAVWSRSGGLAGRQETMIVYANGNLEIERDGSQINARTDMATIKALQQTFGSGDWKGLEARYGRQNPDAFQYTVQAGGKSVTTFDGAPNPPLLERILQDLSRLSDSAGTQ